MRRLIGTDGVMDMKKKAVIPLLAILIVMAFAVAVN